MSDQAAIAQSFGALSDDDKKESFERSTLKLVLRNLGASAGRIKGWECELGPAFDWNWFNGQGWMHCQLVSDRIFSYDLIGLLTETVRMKDPVVANYYQHVRETWDRNQFVRFAVIFKCYERGRYAACSWEPEGNFLRACPAGLNPFYVTPLSTLLRGLRDTIGE